MLFLLLRRRAISSLITASLLYSVYSSGVPWAHSSCSIGCCLASYSVSRCIAVISVRIWLLLSHRVRYNRYHWKWCWDLSGVMIVEWALYDTIVLLWCIICVLPYSIRCSLRVPIEWWGSGCVPTATVSIWCGVYWNHVREVNYRFVKRGVSIVYRRVIDGW